MWDKTLPQVLELQESCEVRDSLMAAAQKDAEIAAKNNKP
jgi:hypothetical protein